MIKETKTIYKANDGTVFEDELECRSYELNLWKERGTNELGLLKLDVPYPFVKDGYDYYLVYVESEEKRLQIEDYFIFEYGNFDSGIQEHCIGNVNIVEVSDCEDVYMWDIGAEEVEAVNHFANQFVGFFKGVNV